MQRILAIGGGCFTAEKEASPINVFVRDLTGKERPKVCFIATPSGDSPAAIEKFHEAYGELGCETSNLAFFNQRGPKAIPYNNYQARLMQQDAIFVSGGNIRSALAVWREYGLDNALREAWKQGILLAGVSAGAMCWFESPLGGPFDQGNYGVQDGLGLLEGACAAHYSNVEVAERRKNLLSELQTGRIPPTLAIDDFAAVLFDGTSIDKVLSWRPGATAYRVEKDQLDGKVVEHAISTMTIGSPPPDRPPRQSTAVDPAVLRNCVGQYQLMSPAVITITMENGSLYAQITGQDRFEIYPENDRTFFWKVVDAQATFQADESGQVTSLILHQNGRDTPASKMAKHEPL
jgi:dipeptidase E